MRLQSNLNQKKKMFKDDEFFLKTWRVIILFSVQLYDKNTLTSKKDIAKQPQGWLVYKFNAHTFRR